MPQMAPIHDRVLIKPLEDEQKTAGGILLPKGPPKANSDAHFGEVRDCHNLSFRADSLNSLVHRCWQ